MQPETIRQANIETYRFLKRRGITSQDIESHPRADDVVLLTAIKDHYHQDMNPSQLSTWAAYWSTVYFKKNALKPKALTKLKEIVLDIEYKKFIEEENRRDQLKKIRALRDQLKD